MTVVVVESPAKAKTINKYLGKDFKVLASYGHVRDLPAKDGSVRPDADFEMGNMGHRPGLKGGYFPHEIHMYPAQKPARPSVAQLHRNGRLIPPNYLHESWMDYLYWDAELDA